MLTQDQLKQILHYDPETGLFTWINDYNSHKVCQVAGSIMKKGYISIYIEGKNYLAHRLAWLYVTGNWPTQVIDHEDRNRSNNRFKNLRDVSQGDNAKNRLDIPGLRIYHNRITGTCSAHRNVQPGKTNGKWVYIGSFASETEAIEKYKELASATPL